MLSQWKTNYTPPPKQCDAVGVKPLKLSHLQGVFIILAAGIFSGFFLIPVETIVKSRKESVITLKLPESDFAAETNDSYPSNKVYGSLF